MNRFETADIFYLLSDPDQLKIVKMTYHHGNLTVEELISALGIPENAVLSKLSALVNGGLLHLTSNGYDCNRGKVEEALGFLSHHCGEGGHHEDHCCGGHHHEEKEESHHCCCGHHHEE